ncbi:RNase adapter RapZ [Rhodobacteraceae bacterium NNCM2]|nr:RNase adapter RapZ [Coraliihabitans acroporae]
MTEKETSAPNADRHPAPVVLLITGMSGAGRSTAINTFEDMGYEAVDNFPLALIDQLVAPISGTSHPMALGIAPRTRGFSVRAVAEAVESLRKRWQAGTVTVFLDCADEKLLDRFSETRRRHPMAPEEDPATGIARERDLLMPLRDHADAVIDTTHMTPHQLRAELNSRFSLAFSSGLSVSVQSFSYKRGAPHEADMVLDCRFLRNPYWDPALRALDGRDPQIQGFVREDPLFAEFFDRMADLLLMLLPAYQDEGKTYFSIALGCTGGRHRSVAIAEKLTAHLKEHGWQTSVRHRELDR